MILILCVDDNNGMMFNHRRQSRDKVLSAHILNIVKNDPLWMNAYSASLFNMNEANIIVDEAFLSQAGEGDYCFVENIDITPYEEKVEKIILYKWNRDYPDDFYFTLPLAEHGWNLTETNDFAGYSHEKITEEIYTRETANAITNEEALQETSINIEETPSQITADEC